MRKAAVYLALLVLGKGGVVEVLKRNDLEVFGRYGCFVHREDVSDKFRGAVDIDLGVVYIPSGRD